MNNAAQPGLLERKDRRENHARILEAARLEFAANGRNAEMKDIADRAGVGVGTLYRHFDSREGLIAAIIEDMHAMVIDRMRAAIDGKTPPDAVRAMMAVSGAIIEEAGALIEIAVEEFERKHGDTADPFQTLFSEVLGAGIEQGYFRDDLDVELVGAIIGSLFVSGQIFELGRARGFHEVCATIGEYILRACVR